MSKNEEQKPKTWKRELIEWGIMLSVFGLIYMMGWHTELSGRLQQALLWTGFIQPDIELTEKERVAVDYDMPLLTLSGEQANLMNFKGDVIFLNFWATWCPPCIAEMPNIQALYEQYSYKEDITFIMVSLDENPLKARQFLEDRGFTFGGYRLNGIRPDVFRSSTIPTTYVINKEGRLVSTKRGMANYNTPAFKRFLDELLAK